MRLLGAILCGGAARRFGSDKALALLDGLPLAEHVRRGLAPQVEAVVACGRPLLDLEGIADRPAPGLGPLGAINAALHFAAERGYDAVLTAPCDTPRLPPLTALTARPPAFLTDLPVVGCWPVTLAAALDDWLATAASRSVRGWAAHVGASPVDLAGPIANVNRPDDLIAIAGPDRNKGE